MAISTFPVVAGAQIVDVGDTTAKMEPGTICAYRSGTDQWAVLQYVQIDATAVKKGAALVQNFATLKQYSVKAAATADAGTPLAGVAMASTGAAKYGWMAIHGWVETVELSHTAASGEYLMISGSTAAMLTPDKASVFNAGTHGSSSMFMVVAVARTAIATGTGSITINHWWGV